MFYALLTIHVLLCLVLIGLVLLQQGKGADLGAALGGGSNSLFGAGGATTLVIKVTTGVAVAFMITSILLVRTYNGHVQNQVASPTDLLQGSKIDAQAAKEVEAVKKEEVPVPPAVPAASAPNPSAPAAPQE